VPLDWAKTQMDLGLALGALGERESGTARLEEAVAAYREALQEYSRARVPLEWAMTQNNLGLALGLLGGRESGTARLDEAAAAFREALQEFTRARATPVGHDPGESRDFARSPRRAGERDSAARGGRRRLSRSLAGTDREAITAYRDALQENTRERVPLEWAATQLSLGAALATLGERESGTARLEEAITAYHEALQELTRARAPLRWAATTGIQGLTLTLLAERRGDAGMAKLAVQQIEAAFTTLRDGGDAHSAAIFEAKLTEARALAQKLAKR
jgi:exonuclease VII small subunit